MSPELVLCAGCMPAAPFREYVAAAAGAGFDAISIWPLMYRRATTREGLDAPTMRAIVSDHGLRISDLDPAGVWLPEPPNASDLPPMFRSVWTREQFFEVATSLGVGSLTAVELAGVTPDHDVAVEGFAALCDDAAERGLNVTLEFIPFSGIADLSAAMRIVTEADRPNGAVLLDVCHFARSGGTLADLAATDLSRIVSVQLADGPAETPADLREEAMWHRLLPGDGTFGVVGVLAALGGQLDLCRIGPELYRRGFSEREPAVVAADVMAATRRVLTPMPPAP